jgi:predicted nucleic acid-binding protein
MQRAEIVFFMKSEEETDTLLFISQFKTAPIDQRIIDAAAVLYRRWQQSHGLDINDAILAATVMQTGGQIFCLNTKHYPVPDLLIKKAW